jgi:hypothetical protein
VACFSSELMWNYGYNRQLVGLLGRVNSLAARPLPTQDNINTEETRPDIRTSSGIRTHDPSVWAGEDISCLKSCGHCGRLNLSALRVNVSLVYALCSLLRNNV